MSKGKVFLVLTLSLCVFAVEANQRIRVQEQVKIQASISAAHLNHIAIESDRILSVKALQGQFELDKGSDLGHIFIKPLETAQNPMAIFLATESGKTYLLELDLNAHSAQSIVLDPGPIEHRETDYLSRLQKIIVALHREEALEGFVQKTVNKRIRFSKVLEGRVIQVLQGPDFEAEILEVQNIGSKPLILEELDVYQENVQAMSIVDKVLLPKALTRLYWIKK